MSGHLSGAGMAVARQRSAPYAVVIDGATDRTAARVTDRETPAAILMVAAAVPHTSRRAMGQIRSFAEEDVAAVARLFQATFRGGGEAPASLSVALADTFLRHPLFDPQVSSRVHVGADGIVTGFIGVIPARMDIGGERLRVAVAGSLMVDAPEKDPLAGARLMRSFLGGPQDLSVSETANEVSVRLWTRARGDLEAGYSLDWLRVLRPAALAVAIASERQPLARLARPLAAPVDAVARRLARDSLTADQPETSGREVGEDELIPALIDLAGAYSLRPAWDPQLLHWYLRQATDKERYGLVRRRLLFDRRGALVGCSIFYARRRGIAWVLQLLAAPGSEAAVIADVVAEADVAGCSGVRGRAQPRFFPALMRSRAVFLHRSSTVVLSAREDVRNAIRSGDALITGLAGESWTRLIGGEFA